jgi:hypothetical protein
MFEPTETAEVSKIHRRKVAEHGPESLVVPISAVRWFETKKQSLNVYALEISKHDPEPTVLSRTSKQVSLSSGPVYDAIVKTLLGVFDCI